jgi:hypothetical protein
MKKALSTGELVNIQSENARSMAICLMFREKIIGALQLDHVEEFISVLEDGLPQFATK